MRKILFGLLGLLFAIPSFANCNLFNKNQELLHLAGTTGTLGTNEHRDGVYIAIEPNTTYTLSNPDGIYINIVMTESLPTAGVRSLGYFNMATQNTYTFTSVENAHYAYLFTGEGSSFSNVIFERNMFNLSTARESALLYAYDGTLKINADGFYVSDYIPVRANETYIISPANIGTSVYGMAWYDANKQYISGSLFNYDVLRVTAPANAAFARTSYASAWGDTFSFRPAYCSEITVATTKYVETEFSALNTALANAVATVNTVVTNTINQAASIATLQSGKQTRPADNTECPAGKKCLLVEDVSGVPHWYEIFDPINRWLEALFITSGNPHPQFTDNNDNFTRWQGNPIWRRKYIDNNNYVYSRQWNATPVRNVGGMYQTLSAGDTENAGTWAVEYDGTEGDGMKPGVVYGIAKCSSVAGPNNGSTATPSTLSDVDAEAWAELPAPYGETDREGYERAKFTQCWCKMTAVGVPGADGTAANGAVYPISETHTKWVYANSQDSSSVCAYNCGRECAYILKGYKQFRQAVFGLSD